MEGEVAELVCPGDLCAEGLLGADDGAGHVSFFDGGVVEDEVQDGGGVGDAVGYHSVMGGGIEGSGCVQGETRELEETADLSVRSPGKLVFKRCALLCGDIAAERAGSECIEIQGRRVECC